MSFSRFENLEACTREQTTLGHSIEDANKICGDIQDRAQKGALLKAQSEGLQVLSKAGDEDIVLGGYASWAIEDDDGDFFTVEAQSKALERFFKQAPEYRNITVNHGRSCVGEVPIGQPLLKYVDKAGHEYFSHVNEAGTFLLTKLRNDDLTATTHFREKARLGQLNGYSVNAFPLKRDATDSHRILDMEYSVITVTEKGVMRPRNPRTRNVEVLSKAADLAVINDEGKLVLTPDASMQYPLTLDASDKALIEAILAKHGFTKS
jgi:hypothetical protein